MSGYPPENESFEDTPIYANSVAGERPDDTWIDRPADELDDSGTELLAEEEPPFTPAAATVARPQGFDEPVTGTTGAAYDSAAYDSAAYGSGYGNPTTGSGSGSDSGSGKADAAKGAAKNVAGDAAEAGQHVAGVAKEQAGKVVSEATDHARELLGQAGSGLKEQAGQQQERVAGGLRSISSELGSMADGSEQDGVAAKVVRDLSNRAGSLAGYLEDRDPGSLLDEVKSFAARRPGTFIALAAGAGILAGRLTKALTTEVKHEHEAEQAGSTGDQGFGGGAV